MDERSRHLRQLSIDGLEGGGRGHIGSTMSLIEVMRALFDEVLQFDPSNPDMPERDRLVLSKGHGCLALYALLADKGFFPEGELKSFCRYDSILGGHPERSHIPGVEASTGSLGHGLSIGVGMAIAARIRSQSHRVFVVLGDGELNEGSIWEAALGASHHKLDNLTVIVDYNGMQSYGRLEEVWNLESVVNKWESFGFDSTELDGHDVAALTGWLDRPNRSARPRALVARTTKGKGITFAENNPNWHHKARISGDEITLLRQEVKNA